MLVWGIRIRANWVGDMLYVTNSKPSHNLNQRGQLIDWLYKSPVTGQDKANAEIDKSSQSATITVSFGRCHSASRALQLGRGM